MTDREQPILYTPKAGDVLFTRATLDAVEMTNHTDRIAGYAVAVIPKAVVKLAAVPWRQVARDVGAAVEEGGVLGLVQKLFKR